MDVPGFSGIAGIQENQADMASAGVDIFGNYPLEHALKKGRDQFIYPVATISNEGPFTFQFPDTGEGNYIDLGQTRFEGTVKVWKKDASTPSGLSACTVNDVHLVNMFPQSLFKNIGASMNSNTITVVSTAAYMYKSYIETIFSYGQDAARTHLQSEMFGMDTPENYDNFGGNSGGRTRSVHVGEDIYFSCPLHLDLMNLDRFLPNGQKLTIEFERNNDNFSLISKPRTGNLSTPADSTAEQVRLNKKRLADELAAAAAAKTGSSATGSQATGDTSTGGGSNATGSQTTGGNDIASTGSEDYTTIAHRSIPERLTSGSATPQYEFKIEFKDFRLKFRVICIDQALAKHHQILFNKGKRAVYPIIRSVIRTCAYTPGSDMATWSNLFKNIPNTLIVGLVSTAAYNGSLTLNPYNFKTYDVKRLTIDLNGEVFPAGVRDINWDTQDYIQAYRRLTDNTGLLHMNAGHQITPSQFKGGSTFYAFDFSPDSCLNFHRHSKVHGTMNMNISFKSPVEEAFTVVCFATYNDVIELDAHQQFHSEVSVLT